METNIGLDRMSCNMCKIYGNSQPQTPEVTDACRRCGIALFSDDTTNIYPSPYLPSPYPLYYNTPQVGMFTTPSYYPPGHYYGSFYKRTF